MGNASDIARTILEGFDRHYRIFRETAARAKDRFERAAWAEVREASQRRIDMYDTRVFEAVGEIGQSFPDAGSDEALWPEIKRAYVGLLLDHKQPECAETFFNSVARRVLDRHYYDNEHIFDRPAVSTEHLDGAEPTYSCYYPPQRDLRDAFRAILESFELANDFQDLERDVGFINRAIHDHFGSAWALRPNFQIHVLRSLFFRNKAAYVVGRVLNGSHVFPFAVPLLLDDERRVVVDTVLLDARDLGRLFSLGLTYFMVDMEVPSAYVEFLSTVVPQKPKAELYTCVGLQKQGKTLFFRDLQRHLRHSTDTFVLAPGTKGMVMLVFTLPSYAYVFKVIRDWFEPPKDTDRRLVEERYDFVKHHDRVGRLADTLEFSHVSFPLARIDPALLAELERVAPNVIERDGDRLVLSHLYIERRMTPLDLYLHGADEAKLRHGIREYGAAMKDLASANIFPGDILLKNFGVTRWGRVVFYDYDELTDLLSCRFRTLPKPRDDDEEMSSEPWFNVEPGDVFPEQFPGFVFPPGRAREIFLEEHGDLADARTWRERQERLRAGIQEDLFPYAQELRFANRYRLEP
jgi:isocitrate dehydrogenase kinase/phosphatase